MEETDSIKRDTPEPAEARAAEVKRLSDAVKDDIAHWEYAFERMKNWRSFARGKQWPGSNKKDGDDAERQYVVNVTLRHIQQRTAAIYAKNPRFRWRKSKKIMTKLWDGTSQMLEAAQALLQPDPATGLPIDPNMYAVAKEIVSEAASIRQRDQMLSKMGETMTVLYEYQIDEQTYPTKKMMKKQVRGALTCGVAYFKQTFQRATKLSPDGEQAIADHMSRLAEIERLADDLDAGEIQEYDAELEQLQQLIKSIEAEQQIIVREGLALDYPRSENIIPDTNLEYLPGFVGCRRVTEQYCLTVDQIKKIYKVDVSKSYTSYTEKSDSDAPDKKGARVWEIWDRTTGLVCTVCDGYPDYLVEPHAPTPHTERFFPWFALAPNALDDDDDPFPPSDVELIMSQQMEINRSGESLREHRFAARPGHVAAQNIPESDRNSISTRNAHDVITMQSLQAGQKVDDLLQPFPTSPIDPNLYNTGPAFQDILRAVGTQEANLGGAAGATATETSIAESSRQSVLSSMMDEFDDLLTEMAQAGGQMLLLEMSQPQVVQVVGPGAVWPMQSPEEVVKDLSLEVVAGSSGLPNQAVEVQVMERLFPLLIQMPNVDPEWALKKLLATMDDRMNYEDAIQMGALPIMALNGQLQGAANRGASPMAGPGGDQNAPKPDMPQQSGPQMGNIPVTGGPQ